jgi:hypothetical protein
MCVFNFFFFLPPFSDLFHVAFDGAKGLNLQPRTQLWQYDIISRPFLIQFNSIHL